MQPFIRSISLAGATMLLLSAGVNALTITYSTDVGTAFAGSGLTLNQSTGAAATLTYTPNVDSTTAVPSNVNLGNFTLLCPTCSTAALLAGAYFDPFTFNLNITDVTDGGARGTFVGTSAGGDVYSDMSRITINWAPLVLGPGTVNASFGNFGRTIFTTTVFTSIPAPNSGPALPGGVVTVQGFVTSGVPEPATGAIVGLSLIGLAFLRRKAKAS
jgi:hypothetical protein